MLATMSLSFLVSACTKTQSERTAAAPPPSAAPAVPASAEWPSLPTTGFLSGRPATQQDVSDGNALFVAERAGKIIGVPLTIDIPQYAVHVDRESGVRKRVILLQAERAEGIEMVGYRDLAGEHGIATLAEFELLGKAPGAK